MKLVNADRDIPHFFAPTGEFRPFSQAISIISLTTISQPQCQASRAFMRSSNGGVGAFAGGNPYGSRTGARAWGPNLGAGVRGQLPWTKRWHSANRWRLCLQGGGTCIAPILHFRRSRACGEFALSATGQDLSTVRREHSSPKRQQTRLQDAMHLEEKCSAPVGTVAHKLLHT